MYDVYINLEKVKTCETEDEVWDVLDRRAVGSIYEVRYTESGDIVEEFIPF